MIKLGMEKADAFKAFAFIKVPSIEKCLFYLKHGAIKRDVSKTDVIQVGSLTAITLSYVCQLLFSKPLAGTFRSLRKWSHK